MKYLLLFLGLLQLSLNSQTNNTYSIEEISTPVGKLVRGSTSAQTQFKSFHYVKVEKLEKKYLFFRLLPTTVEDRSKVKLSVYSMESSDPLIFCPYDGADSCYLPSQKLKKDSTLIVIVQCESDCKYMLYPYWANVEHLKPDSKIKFKFTEEDPTQLFHLNLKDETYEQIRIVLKPETHRVTYDNVKIYVTLGQVDLPTAEKHDFESVHVWGEAEAVFLSKNQIKDENSIKILIAGNARTVYTMQCEFINKKHHDIEIGETVYQYLDKREETAYHFKLGENKVFEEYSVKFSVFSGEVYVGYYYDENFTKEYEQSPFQYMSDVQFIIDPTKLLSNATSLYVKVKASDTPTIYMLNLQGRKEKTGHQVMENVYDFLNVKDRTAVYFHDYLYFNGDESSMVDDGPGEANMGAYTLYSFSILNVYESLINFTVRVCDPEKSLHFCTNISNPKYEDYSIELKPLGLTQRGNRKICKIQVPEKYYKSINANEGKVTVMVVFTNQGKDTNNLLAFQYYSESKPKLLRDNRVTEEKVIAGQTKYYKYINNDPNIKKLQFRVDIISGRIDFKGQREDFNIIGQPLPNQSQSIITVTDNITKPVYLQVSGLTNAIYTIAIVVTHASHPQSASLTMAEDVEYTFKLQPLQALSLELNPIFENITLEYSSEGGPVVVCQLDKSGSCDHENPSHKEFGQTHGALQMKQIDSRFVNVKMYNYLSMQVIEVKAIYHSNNKSHCEDRKMNEMHDENVRNGQCFRFHQPIAFDIEIMMTRSDIGESITYFMLCDSIVEPVRDRYRTYIPQKTVLDKCKDSRNNVTLWLYIMDSNKKQNQSQRFLYMISYSKDYIMLKDGIAYSNMIINKEGYLQVFLYKILNYKKTQILLTNQKGNQSFTASIRKQKAIYQPIYYENSITPKINQNNNPSVIITQAQITDAECGSDCFLVVELFSAENLGVQIQYTIQITQNSYVLNENQVREDFLAKGSLDYYEYESKHNGESIMVSISDHNRHCTKIYISDRQYPSESNNIASETGNQLILESPSEKFYYIGIEGIQDCPYSITLTESVKNILMLEKGRKYDLELKKGERKFFLVKHMSKSSFKVLSLETYGSINIYANSTIYNNYFLSQLQAPEKISASNFSFSNSYKNVLYISKDDKHFVSDSYYLVMVEANENTLTTISVADRRRRISLEKGKTLFDEFQEENQTTLAMISRVGAGNIKARTHQGQIEIDLTYKNRLQQFSITGEDDQLRSYNFTKVDDSPILVSIAARKAPAVYTLEITPDQEEESIRITPGDHYHVTLNNQKAIQLNGFIRNKQQKLLITTSASNAQILSQLTATMKDGGKGIVLKRNDIGNVLSIQFEVKKLYFDQPENYSVELRVKGDKMVELMVIQEDSVNLLPSDVEVPISGSSNYIIHPDHPFVLDLFECTGKSIIKYGKDAKSVQSSPRKTLNSIGLAGQPHAIRIQQFQTAMFLNVEAKQATILWMPIIEEEERGIGYFKYEIGKLTYESEFNNIHFIAEGVRKKETTKTTPKQIKYTLMVSDSSDALQQKVMCQKENKQNVITKDMGTYKNLLLTAAVTADLDKQEVHAKFPNASSLYVSVVADMMLGVPQQQVYQNYKFIYYQQTLPSEVFHQSQIEEKYSENKLLMLIVAGVLGLVWLLMMSVCIIKWLIPLICKLRNRVLVEEGQDNNESIPVPPSSDRNQIEDVGTEEKMG